MENNQNEIQKANKKAIPKFLLILAASGVVGGVFGYCASKFGLDGLAGSLKAAGGFFGRYIAPWAMAALAVILPAVCVPLYRGAKKRLAGWDGEDERESEAIEGRLNLALWLGGIGLILAYILIAAAYSGGFAIFEERDWVVGLFVSIVALVVVMVETTLLQQRCVDMVKRMNPEKAGSVYDPKFRKRWLESCDEAERAMIGQCACKAFAVTQSVCGVLMVVLAIGALTLDIGFLPTLVVGVVWMALQSAFCLEGIRLGMAKK